MANMSNSLKHMPDFYTQSGYLVEVMGCGRDGTLKLKTTKWDALKFWNKEQDVMLFVWNSHKETWALIGWRVLKRLVSLARARGIREFHDGNRYYPILWSEIEDLVEFMGAPDAA